MMSNFICLVTTVLMGLLVVPVIAAQDVERVRPKEWDGLVYGGRFMDLFLPMPNIGELSSDLWGGANVKPRYKDYGLEDQEWSYWGGNIIRGDDGLFHQFVCRWREDAEKGHMEWPNSMVVHATSSCSLGPFHVIQTIGKGHNPEVYKVREGRFILSVNGGYYVASHLNGPWAFHPLVYDQRERPIFDHITNLTYAMREDSSFLMVGRGGEIAFSRSGYPPFSQFNSQSVYPPYEGNYEDPVVWRDNIQYHLIVNDWSGRIAYYLRSPDGINWTLDPGEAYRPGIAVHQDGKVEDWYKFERIKILQDEYGRAVQANFAVADTIKRQDLGRDHHSSKNVGIPLTVGRMIEILDQEKIDGTTANIRILIKAEKGFNPHKDINLKTLRFGSSNTVNFGGGCKVSKVENDGADLVVTFNGEGSGLSEDDFAAKLLGETSKGKLLFAYARLPWYDYKQAALSAKYPVISLNGRRLKAEVEIQNFGQVPSSSCMFELEYLSAGEWIDLLSGEVPVLAPFEKKTLTAYGNKFAEVGELAQVRVIIHHPQQKAAVLSGGIVIR